MPIENNDPLQYCVGLIGIVLNLPTLPKLSQNFEIGSINKEISPVKSCRSGLYITSKGLMERESSTEYTSPEQDEVFDQDMQKRSVSIDEIEEMVKKYNIDPERLRQTITKIEGMIEYE